MYIALPLIFLHSNPPWEVDWPERQGETGPKSLGLMVDYNLPLSTPIQNVYPYSTSSFSFSAQAHCPWAVTE